MRENAAVCRAASPPINYRRLCRRRGLPFSAINRRLRFRANSKMAKGWIPAVACPRVGGGGNDGDIHPRLTTGGFRRRNIKLPIMLSHYRRWIPAPCLRSRENDGDIKSPSRMRRQSRRKLDGALRHQHSPPCGELIPACAGMTIGIAGMTGLYVCRCYVLAEGLAPDC